MTRTVSAVIPTVGRQSLICAVQSVLDQTRPVAELIVVVDTDQSVNVPTHDRVTILHTPFRGGPAKARQLGIDAARGSVVALLDDDDEWNPVKLERQLERVRTEPDPHWIVSSRMVMVGPGTRQRILPRRIIGPQQSLAEYWFRFSGLRQGGAALQTSTLCFPTELARKIRWDAHVGAAHDEPSWLINVQRAIPELRIIQLPDVLGTYNVQHASESRRPSDCTESYIEWGLQYLSTESGRVLGDYLCTSPVSAAVSAGSLRGVRRSLQSAFQHGRPGPLRGGVRPAERGPDPRPFDYVCGTRMTVDQGRLNPQERRALVLAPVYRVLGTPIVAVLGLANTAIVVRETGADVFGLVSLVATITLLFPFADLGIGSTVLNASSQLSGESQDPNATNVIRRAYHVLFAVAGALVLLALAVMAFDGWAVLIGFSSGPDDRWAITAAACLFALTIPAGLGLRILVGIDRLPLVTLLLMSCPAFALVLTLVLYWVHAPGIWYAVSALGGLLIGEVIGTVLALRHSGLGWSALARVTLPRSDSRLLAGSMWLFIVGVGTPIGLQAGRILLAHLSTPLELSRYSLIAQIYAVCWSALATAGYAYWPVFVKRRAAREQTVRMWWQLTATFAGVAAVAMLAFVPLAPVATRILSGGRIEVSVWLALAFAALLVMQAIHLPSTVLLTKPSEARWQALWAIVMATLSVGLGLAAVARFGAVGVVYASALAILAAQVVPDLAWAPRLVRRRPRGDE